MRNVRPWMLQADIIRFFDRIPRNDVKSLIRRRVGWKIIGDLLCAAVDCELEASNQTQASIAHQFGIQKGRGLRQGMPVSPLLSNLLLKGFDDRLAKRGVHAIRYADDIAIFGESANECRDALRIAQDALAKMSLELPELSDGTKTNVRGPSETALFLGVEVKRFPDGYRLCAPTKKLDDIEHSMAGIAALDECIKQRLNLTQVVRSLDSLVVGHAASMAVLRDGGNFRALLEARKQRRLKAFLVDLLGDEAVSRLDHDRLAVLGLQPF
jgi:hypothetical protein